MLASTVARERMQGTLGDNHWAAKLCTGYVPPPPKKKRTGEYVRITVLFGVSEGG